VRLGVTPEVNAISTLLLGFVGLILAISALALNRPARDLA
jgi:ABC-type spermidine/putrescine transport system permease subunit II